MRAAVICFFVGVFATGCNSPISAEPSTQPTNSASQTASATGCSTTDLQVKLKATKWQVCLPPDAKVAFVRNGNEVTATLQLSNQESIVVGNYQIWSPDNPKPTSGLDAWIEVATNQKSTLAISSEQDIPGNLSDADLTVVSKVATDYLGDPTRYSIAP